MEVYRHRFPSILLLLKNKMPNKTIKEYQHFWNSIEFYTYLRNQKCCKYCGVYKNLKEFNSQGKCRSCELIEKELKNNY